MKTGIFTSISFLTLSLHLSAQVEGIVVNKETNTPVPYANIWVANKDIGTTSDTDGSFFLKNLPGVNSLIISASGIRRLVFRLIVPLL